MSAGANPLQMMMAGGQSGGPPSGPGTGGAALLSALQGKQGGGGPADEYSQQVSELQGADPAMLLKQLEQINKLLGVLFVTTFQRLPNVANNISATMKQLSRAIKEAQQGASTASVIGRNPINFSAAQPSAGPEAGAGAQPAAMSAAA